MSSTFDNSTLFDVTPSGHSVTLSVLYNDNEKRGIWVLVGAAGSSLLAVLVLLTILAISAYKTFRKPSEHLFIRTHVVAYFISLLLCDAIAAAGSLMNIHWISRGGVFLGPFCTSQGALKNTGNIGTALWTMVIAIHTFCLLVLKWKPREHTLYTTLFVVWSFIGLVVIIGPTAFQNLTVAGPYFGVSGYWCWITDGYIIQRVMLEYFWMFLSALVSLLLYTAVFLTLRGNIVISGGRLRLRLRRSSSVWESQLRKHSPDGQVTSMAKHMLPYPIAYCALILPIAICRFLRWGGHEIPFEATIFADAVFLLSGLVNAILFTTTRRIVPTHEARGLFSRSKSSEFDVESPKSITSFVTPFTAVERLIVPPIPIERKQEILVVPVTLPPPTLQKSPRSSRSNIKRGLSFTPTISSVYSQSSWESNVAPPPMPTRRPYTIHRSIVAPLKVVKKFSAHKAPADVPVEATEWSDMEVGESEYGSPQSPSPTLAILPPSPLRSHSRGISSPTRLNASSHVEIGSET